MKNKFLRIAALFVISCLSSMQALAEFKSTVYWGGVSFSDWEMQEEKFPFVASTLCRAQQCAGPSIDTIALKSLQVAQFDEFNVSMDYISTRSVERIIITPMITGESVNVVEDKVGDKTSFIHTYRIYATLTFFEFGSGRFIAAKPVITQFTDSLDHRATDAEHRATFVGLLDGAEGQGLFDLLFSSAKNLRLSNLNDRFIRLSSVSIEPDALSVLDFHGSESTWSSQIAKLFESFLVRDTNAPFVPFSPGSELTSELSATFANGAQVISLPKEVPYNVKVTVNKLAEMVSVDRKAKTVCHAVALTLEVEGPLDSILSQRLLRTRESCGVVATEKKLDPAYYFTQSVLSLLNEVSKNINDSPRDEFFKRAAPKDKNVKKKFVTAWRSVFKSDW